MDNAVYGKKVKISGTELTTLELTANGAVLDLRHDLANHSAEFNVGYLGSGPTQTALAILSFVVGDEFAIKDGRYQMFKEDVIAELPQNEDFEIPFDEVRDWAAKQT